MCCHFSNIEKSQMCRNKAASCSCETCLGWNVLWIGESPVFMLSDSHIHTQSTGSKEVRKRISPCELVFDRFLHILYTSRAARCVGVHFHVCVWHWVQRNSLQHCAYPASFTRFHSSIISRIIICSPLCPLCLTSTGIQGGTPKYPHTHISLALTQKAYYPVLFYMWKPKIVHHWVCMYRYRCKILLFFFL